MAFIFRILDNKKVNLVFNNFKTKSYYFYKSYYDETKDIPTLVEIFIEL